MNIFNIIDINVIIVDRDISYKYPLSCVFFMLSTEKSFEMFPKYTEYGFI